jgi:hypothetical protein
MQQFYTLVCRGMSLAGALHEAQLFVRGLTQAAIDRLDVEARCASSWVAAFAYPNLNPLNSCCVSSVVN